MSDGMLVLLVSATCAVIFFSALAYLDRESASAENAERVPEGSTSPCESKLTGGDYLMAVVSFFLTPIVSGGLAVYNFVKGRNNRGLMYVAICAVQIILMFIRVSASRASF